MPKICNLEIHTHLSIEEIVLSIEDSKKEMAPKVWRCTMGPDKTWFVCTLGYGSAYALLKGIQSESSGADVNVEFGLFSVTPLAVTGAAFFAINFLLNRFYFHPKSVVDWLPSVMLIVVIFLFPIAIYPFKKRFLARYISETLLPTSPLGNFGR